jgi:hypothetical protein
VLLYISLCGTRLVTGSVGEQAICSVLETWHLTPTPYRKNSLCEPEKNLIKFNKSLEEKRTKFDFLYTYIK